MKVSLVAAVARNGVIGRDGALPWRLPEDMARFRELTTGHAVVMGRRTWDSLPDRFRPLPDRRNLVVTRNAAWSAEGVERAGSLEEALALATGAEHVFVIGGAEIYAAALTHADELLLTEIDLDVEGDAVFPEWDRREFVETARDSHVSADGTPFAFVTYRSLGALQLETLAAVDGLLAEADIPYWLLGGWAVDFYAGRITRPHDDVDIAVWLEDVPAIAALLVGSGWTHAPEPDEDGGTGYERNGVRLELTYLTRRADGSIVTPLRELDATWPGEAFGDDVRELGAVSAHVIGLAALASGKSAPRDAPGDAAKDRADIAILSDL